MACSCPTAITLSDPGSSDSSSSYGSCGPSLLQQVPLSPATLHTWGVQPAQASGSYTYDRGGSGSSWLSRLTHLTLRSSCPQLQSAHLAELARACREVTCVVLDRLVGLDLEGLWAWRALPGAANTNPELTHPSAVYPVGTSSGLPCTQATTASLTPNPINSCSDSHITHYQNAGDRSSTSSSSGGDSSSDGGGSGSMEWHAAAASAKPQSCERRIMVGSACGHVALEADWKRCQSASGAQQSVPRRRCHCHTVPSTLFAGAQDADHATGSEINATATTLCGKTSVDRLVVERFDSFTWPDCLALRGFDEGSLPGWAAAEHIEPALSPSAQSVAAAVAAAVAPAAAESGMYQHIATTAWDATASSRPFARRSLGAAGASSIWSTRSSFPGVARITRCNASEFLSCCLLPSSLKVAMVSDNDKRSGSAQRPGQFMAYLATLQLQQQRQHNGGSSYAYSLSAPQVVNTSSRTGLNNSSKNRSDTTAAWQCLPALPPPGLPLLTGYGFGGRGGELSDLLLTPGGGRLLTVDDHTGLVFEVLPELDGVGAAARLGCGSAKLVPRWVLANAAGAGAAGFKAEWCTWMRGDLLVGSQGYEVWPQGTSAAQPGPLPLPSPLQLVARVNLSSGHTTWEDWAPMYRRLATALGVTPPGYVTHEACTWNERHERYFFLPRRVSLNEAWDRRLDESRGAQLLLSCSQAGGDVRVVEITTTMSTALDNLFRAVCAATPAIAAQVRGATDPRRGYSAMRFLPRTQDQHIVALKVRLGMHAGVVLGCGVQTEEPWAGGPCCSYLTVLDLDGQTHRGSCGCCVWCVMCAQVLLPETLISRDMKYEGLEVWPLQG
ncbi:hypothetical protein QJQ45_014797 [Haematococcus lacustris]|nr:hypothetical protein QJQ45_014797 [Haematococcus lacustris]